MITIHKFPLTLSDLQLVEIPVGSEILSVQIQPSSGICLWAMVDDQAKKQKRKFEIVGTGHPIHLGIERRFIGTVQQGQFVWHIFERLEV